MALIVVLTAISLTGGFVVSAQAAVVRGPWVQSDANAAQSRTNLTDTSISPETVADLRYRRSLTIPPPNQDPLASCASSASPTPVLADGALFLLANNTVTRYNPDTGAVRWQAATDDDVLYTSVAVSGGLVVIAGTNCASGSDPQSSVVAYAEATGISVWAQGHDGESVSHLGVSGGYVIYSGASVYWQRTEVLRLATGRVVWTRRLEACSDVGDNAVVVGGRVIWSPCATATTATHLEADALSTGTVLWRRPGAYAVQRGDNDSSAGRHVFVNLGSVLRDVDPATGDTRFSLSGTRGAVLAVDRQRVYVDCGQYGLCAYAISTGAPAWSQDFSATGIVAVANGVLYTGEGSALDAASGAFLATVFSSSSTSVLLEGGGRVVVVSDPRVVDVYK